MPEEQVTLKPKRGRPKTTVVNYPLVERLGKIGATQAEVATVLQIPLGTLEKDPEFIRAHKKGLADVKMTIRRKQIEQAKKGNTTVLIWLGKQLLGQSDKPLPTEQEMGALEALALAFEASRREHGL
jgi:hypothetical protein